MEWIRDVLDELRLEVDERQPVTLPLWEPETAQEALGA